MCQCGYGAGGGPLCAVVASDDVCTWPDAAVLWCAWLSAAEEDWTVKFGEAVLDVYALSAE